MNDLIRPALYQSYHEIVPVRQPVGAAREVVDVVGPVCESGDFFAQDRELPPLAGGRSGRDHERRRLRFCHGFELQLPTAARGGAGARRECTLVRERQSYAGSRPRGDAGPIGRIGPHACEKRAAHIIVLPRITVKKIASLSHSSRCAGRPVHAAATPEYILLVGGPSLMQWEKYKVQPHDHWWANFVRAARIRTEQLRAKYGPDAKITWLVYKQGYIDRGAQEKQDLLGFIGSRARQIQSQPGLLPQRRRRDQLSEQRTAARPDEDCLPRILRPFEQSLFHVRLQQQCRQRVEVVPAPEPVRRRSTARRSPATQKSGAGAATPAR